MRPQQKILYNKRVWLNPSETSIATGAVTLCSSILTDEKGEEEEYHFCEIDDCYHKVKLHQMIYDSREDFIKKMKLLRKELDSYIEFLENLPEDIIENKEKKDDKEA